MAENYSIQYYNQRIEKLTDELNKLKSRSRLWIAIRLISFIEIILILYFTFPYNLFSSIGIIISIVLFLFFIRKSVENKEQLNYIQQLINLNEDEIKASRFDYSSFNSGEEYIDSKHAFSFDMDLFGEGSFFQIFNRTVTKKGERLLVDYLLRGTHNPIERTEAIDELTKNKSWSQGFLAHGKTLDKEETDVNIAHTIQKQFTFKPWVKPMQYILPVLAVIFTGAFYFDVINFYQFFIIAILLMIPVRQTLKTTNFLHRELNDISERVNAMRNQLLILEEIKFESPLLMEYQQQLFNKQQNGKEGLIELAKIIKEINYRDNILVAVLLNFYLAWDFRLLIKFKQWKFKYDYQVEGWEEILYDFEALISGAVFRFNFKEHTSTPILSQTDDSEIIIKKIGHPIIPLEKLVKNDFTLLKDQQFSIITGPNMAGKSTFLRSLGINIMLAKAGFHVMAERFEFPNIRLYSSMKTSDALKDDTSYFHAELIRLRFIMDAIEKGEKVFIILDEILKGTNSKDKQEGSLKFIQKLNQLSVKGIIATHDLSLTELASQYPTINNLYFDTEINNDEISFDYIMRDGVAKNMNASFLLRKMGIIDN